MISHDFRKSFEFSSDASFKEAFRALCCEVYIAQLKAGFEEQLALAYQQIDQITETLQKELQTKEELAQELRDACAAAMHSTLESVVLSRYEKNRKIVRKLS